MNFEKHVFVCTNHREADPESSCAAKGGIEIQKHLKEQVNSLGLKSKFRINQSGCLGVCKQGPALVIYPKNEWYGPLTISQANEIFEKCILKEESLPNLQIKSP